MKVFKIMSDGYITSKNAMKIFEEKNSDDKIKILKKALAEKCESKEHIDYIILKHTKEVSYSDIWGDDKVGFLYKLLTWKKEKK